MGYQLVGDELTNYRDLVSLISGADPIKVNSNYWDNSIDYKGKYYYLYNYLAGVQTDATGNLKAGAENAAVAWLKGATQVNQNSGPYADFIRSYTQHQVDLRGTTSSGTMQDASDAIARGVIDLIDSNNNTIPSILQIGQNDAGSTVGNLFGTPGDFSAWSGSPLFTILGEGSFFDSHIIDKVNNTYDLLAMIDSFKAGASAVDGTITSLGDLITAMQKVWAAGGSNIAPLDAASLVYSELTKAGSWYDDQFDSPVGGLSAVLGSNLKIGKLNDSSTSIGGSGDDAIAGGNKDDVIQGSTGRDLVDGGDGMDTLDYSKLDQALTVKFDKNKGGDVTLDIQKGTAGRDSATRVEHLVLGSAADILKLDNAAFNSENLQVDGGAQPDGNFDVVSFSNIASGVGVSQDLVNGKSVVNTGDHSISLSNFEGVVGSKFDDIISMSGQGSLIYGLGGNDIVHGSDFDDLLAGGSGSDDIFTGGGADRVIMDLNSSHPMTYTDPDTGETYEYDEPDTDTVEDGSATDRLFIRETGADGTDRLIPILGGDSMRPGFVPESNPPSSFENDPNFFAELHTSWMDGDGQRVDLGGGLSQDLDVFYSRNGDDLNIDARYGNDSYSTVLKNFHTGDYGINFVNGLNYMFTDGVKSWETSGLDTMRSAVSSDLASGSFSSAPSETKFI